MKKLIVNTDGCIGCGACIGIDEEHFDFNEDNLSVVKSQENLDSEALKDAIASCPVSVIELTTSDCENENCDCEGCHCEEDCNCEEDNCDCNDCDCNDDEKAA